MDFWSLEAKAGEWPCISNTRFRVISQAVLTFKHRTMSTCAQAYLLISLFSASEVYRVCLDQHFKLDLAMVRARNQHFVQL